MKAPLRVLFFSLTLLLTATANGQGSIYLTGHDTLLHAGQNGYDLVVLDYLRCAGTPDEIPASSYTIAVIGSAGSGSWLWSNFTQTAPTGYPTVTFIDADSNPALSDWTTDLGPTGAPLYDCVVVLSHTSCGGCSMTDTGSDNLNVAQTLIQSHFNQGMDIWANAGANYATYYDFLPSGFVSTAPPVSGSVYCATTDGTALGLDCTMTACCATHNSFVAFSTDLTVMEMECTDVCGSPPTGAVISLGAKGITLGACAEITNDEVLCDLDDSGNYTLTFDLTNNSGFPVRYLLFLPPAGISVVPTSVIVLGSDLADGDTTTVSVTFSGGIPGDELCFTMGMMTPDFVECCSLEHCITVPDCTCAQIHDESIECVGDGTNDFIYTFQVDNLTGQDIYYSFFIPLTPPDITFDEGGNDIVEYAPLPDNGTATVSVIISGADPGEEICFILTMHNEGLDECCAIEICITAPDCTIGGCDIECPAGSIAEGEVCDEFAGIDVFNGGCATFTFTNAFCDETICGESWALGGVRDEDWFELDLASEMLVELQVTADFDAEFGYAAYFPGSEGTGCGELTGKIIPIGTVGDCDLATLTVGPLVAGVHYFVIRPQVFDGLPCALGNEYAASWTCFLPASPCDINGDGVVDVVDLLIVLANWGSCCDGDVNGDGIVDVTDLLLILGQWD